MEGILLPHMTLRNVGVALIAVVVVFLMKGLKIFFFPRKGALKESYPFHNTILLAKSQNVLLELCLKYFMETNEKTKKKTFLLEVIGLPTFVMTIDVANVTHVLKTNFENYGKDAPIFKAKMQGLLGDGIFNADGQQWFAHRKTSAHLFKLSEFKSTVLDTFNHDLTTVVRYIQAKKGRTFDLHALMHKLTLESISKIAFGIQFGCISDNEVDFANDFDFCTACINDSMTNPFWLFDRYCTPTGWKYFYCLYRLNKFASKLIKERRKQMEVTEHNANLTGRSDLLSLYLNKDSFRKSGGEAEDGEDGKKSASSGYADAFMEPTDQNLRDVILNMVIAGRDTTAQALSWTFYRLCIHPEVQRKVREEIAAVSARSNIFAEEGYTYAFIQQLKYTEAVCMEALRLHPSVPKEGKCVMKDDILPDGTPVKKGDILSFQAWSMGRDKDLWGENALEFEPERFLNNSKPNPFVFTAFQVRACCVRLY